MKKLLLALLLYSLQAAYGQNDYSAYMDLKTGEVLLMESNKDEMYYTSAKQTGILLSREKSDLQNQTYPIEHFRFPGGKEVYKIEYHLQQCAPNLVCQNPDGSTQQFESIGIFPKTASIYTIMSDYLKGVYYNPETGNMLMVVPEADSSLTYYRSVGGKAFEKLTNKKIVPTSMYANTPGSLYTFTYGWLSSTYETKSETYYDLHSLKFDPSFTPERLLNDQITPSLVCETRNEKEPTAVMYTEYLTVISQDKKPIIRYASTKNPKQIELEVVAYKLAGPEYTVRFPGDALHYTLKPEVLHLQLGTKGTMQCIGLDDKSQIFWPKQDQ